MTFNRKTISLRHALHILKLNQLNQFQLNSLLCQIMNADIAV